MIIMKKLFLVSVLTTVFLFPSELIHAQKIKHVPVPKWVPEKGSWIVESNIKTPDQSVIYFYSSDMKLIYKEKLESVILNLNNKKVLMRLKKLLARAVTSWERTHIPHENQMLLAAAFKKKDKRFNWLTP